MSALVFLSPGFEEIEGITVIDILRRAGIETVAAGIAPNPIQAARQTRHLADQSLSEVDFTRSFEIIVIPGGALGAKSLAEDRLVKAWLAKQQAENGWIGAICAGPTVLLAHGLLPREAQIVAHPSVQGEFPPGQVDPAAEVILWKKLLTGRAAGSAMKFAFEIVRLLRGDEMVKRVNHGVLACPHDVDGW